MAFWKEKREGNRRLKEVIGIVQEPSGTLETDAVQLATLQREICVANTGLRRHYWSSQLVFRAQHTLMPPLHYGYNKASTAKSGFPKWILPSLMALGNDAEATVIYLSAVSLCTHSSLIWILKVWWRRDTDICHSQCLSDETFLKNLFLPTFMFPGRSLEDYETRSHKN